MKEYLTITEVILKLSQYKIVTTKQVLHGFIKNHLQTDEYKLQDDGKKKIYLVNDKGFRIILNYYSIKNNRREFLYT